jgi:hypothetical protein
LTQAINKIDWLAESERINRLPHVAELNRKWNELNQAAARAFEEAQAAFEEEAEKVRKALAESAENSSETD